MLIAAVPYGADYSRVSERVTAHPSRAARTGHPDMITHPTPIGPPTRVVNTRQMKPARIPAGSSGPSTDHQRRSNPCRSDAQVNHAAARMAASTDPLPAARSAAGLTGKGRMRYSAPGYKEEYRSPVSHQAATGTASTSATAPASTSHLTPASCEPAAPATAPPAARAGPPPTARAAATPAPAPASWSAITATSSGGTYRQRRPGAISVPGSGISVPASGPRATGIAVPQLAVSAGECGARARLPADPRAGLLSASGPR